MRSSKATRLATVALFLGGIACGSSVTTFESSSAAGAGGDSESVGVGAAGPGSGTQSSSGSGVPTGLSCHDVAPPGAPPPAPLASAAGCPMLVPGFNDIDGRKLLVVWPSDLAPDESLPVAFLWHWLGGDAQSFFDKAEVQGAADHYRFVAVIPEVKGDLQFKWPIESVQSQARIDEEYAFFDRILACLDASVPIVRHCVSSVGVSAGAIWTQVLASGRGEYLSSLLSLSGGEGGLVQAWKGSTKKMPAMVLWGGDKDNCFGLMDFGKMSKTLEGKLGDEGHFLLECVHNCGHSPPPFALPGAPTPFTPMWEFILDHPGWLPPGASPYVDGGVPTSFPTWCSVGAGKATPRTGECLEKSGC